MVTELAADPSVRVTEGGRVVIGGSPLRVLRLTEAGARVVADVVAGRPVDRDGRPAVERGSSTASSTPGWSTPARAAGRSRRPTSPS